jgi:hypothetical protein
MTSTIVGLQDTVVNTVFPAFPTDKETALSDVMETPTSSVPGNDYIDSNPRDDPWIDDTS